MKFYLAFLTLLLLPACEAPKTRFEAYHHRRADSYTGEVKILPKLPPKGTYKLIGTVIAESYRLQGDKAMLESLKKRAARQGANAIILDQDAVQITSPGSEVFWGRYSAAKHVSATAIITPAPEGFRAEY